ncbi:MAG: hypothetical protein BAJATHORv1_60141 [Candidatus Thorarchaeota archaeon]|nr:MAG: hypothetical protein BAJATHORv1_60141 [Candidatus Thorarchaeota archaeon]
MKIGLKETPSGVNLINIENSRIKWRTHISPPIRATDTNKIPLRVNMGRSVSENDMFSTSKSTLDFDNIYLAGI